MQLEFESGYIPESVFSELELQEFLSQFEIEIPLIPHKILRPLGEREAKEWFGRLSALETQIKRHNIDLECLLATSNSLLLLDELLPFFRDQQLEPYHVFDMGRFLRENANLARQEKSIPLSVKGEICIQISRVLDQNVTEDYSNIRLDAGELELRDSINRFEDKIARELELFEKEIFRQTGLKLIYPYPKEIAKDDTILDRVRDCQHLELSDEGDFFKIVFKLSSRIEKLIADKEAARNHWAGLMEEKLAKVNRDLAGYYSVFSEYYKTRKQRIFDYVLLAAIQKFQLCIPTFSTEPAIKLREGILPKLKGLRTTAYKPLNLDLGPGVNLLFGANMTGKTTVLKTLYFQLTLVKFGLPVPAEKLVLSHPPSIELQLKSSGNMGLGLSGFADEIRFFCKKADPSSVFLIDEMFHSTDPINGVELSKAFLTGLSYNCIYLCTSHYPEVLNIPGIRFFRMKDLEGEINTGDIEKLLKQVPYEVEEITAHEMKRIIRANKKPLLIALQFPLPEKVKMNIQKKINQT